MGVNTHPALVQALRKGSMSSHDSVCAKPGAVCVHAHELTELSQWSLVQMTLSSFRNMRSGSKKLSYLAKLYYYEFLYSFIVPPNIS